jgi:hypothetical protein
MDSIIKSKNETKSYLQKMRFIWHPNRITFLKIDWAIIHLVLPQTSTKC